MQSSFSHTILVVDDNPVNLHALKAILDGAGYEVIAGSNSDEALEMITNQSPDIILLDVMMPGMDGFSLCRRLKKDPDFSNIPIIFLTSLSQKEDIIEGFNAGGNDYITKPFNQQELLARVRNHLHMYDVLLENKRLIELSDSASRSKTEFLASMSHEIRTPLNSIIGMAEVLSDTELSPEQHEYVRISRSAGESLLEIINDILDLSKIEAGQTELESIDFHLPSLLDSVVSILSVRAVEQNTQLSIHIAKDVPAGISCDPTRLRQILINLVGNGLKFTKNGTVAISVALDSRQKLLFAIKDSGIGIPKDKQELVFESFTQADSVTTRKYGGTGLGLTICQKLTAIMNGKIWLESVPDQGSTFFFTCSFRKALSNPLPTTEKRVKSPSCEILPSAHILLVDDNEDNRNLLSLYLQNTPFTFKTAHNGKEAVRMFKSASFDLICMDIEMPVMDGYEATRQIRQWEQEEKLAATPIIALTAHAFVRFKKKCMKAGCSDYLTKPVRRDTLIHTIAAHLQPGQADTTRENIKKSTAKVATVVLDPKIKELIPHFLANKREDANKLLDSIQSENAAKLQSQAHTIKGTSWMYGFKELGDMCLDLEHAAKETDMERAHKLALQITDYLNTLKISYKAPAKTKE